MARVTVNLILNTFCSKHQLKREYIGLDKFEGTYHITEKFAGCMSKSEINTYATKLSTWSLDRWIEHLERILRAEGWQGIDLNQMIESYDWELESP